MRTYQEILQDFHDLNVKNEALKVELKELQSVCKHEKQTKQVGMSCGWIYRESICDSCGERFYLPAERGDNPYKWDNDEEEQEWNDI